MSLVERALSKLKDERVIGAAGDVAAHVAGPAPPNVDATPPTMPASSGAVSGARRPAKTMTVDRAALRAAGMLPPEHLQWRLANEYRRIKRPLLRIAGASGGDAAGAGPLVMVASALPGEGKSFTTMNLAFSISLETDVTALLVDADVANPFISRTFGVDREPGLVDVLRDASLLVDDVIIATDVPGLGILPAGQPVDTAVELLGSARMREVTRQLEGSASRRLVLFDSPPLLLTNESRVLCDMVGQILLVVRAGVTERPAVAQALGLLPAEKPVNLVLNQAVAGAEDAYYGYGEYGSYSARST